MYIQPYKTESRFKENFQTRCNPIYVPLLKQTLVYSEKFCGRHTVRFTGILFSQAIFNDSLTRMLLRRKFQRIRKLFLNV